MWTCVRGATHSSRAGRQPLNWDVTAAPATVLIAIILAIVGGNQGREALAEPPFPEHPVRPKVAALQPRYLCEPARLGADETTTSRHFQIIDFNGDRLPDIFQLSYGPDRAWLILNRGSAGRPYLDRPSRFPCNFADLRGNPLNTTDAWAVDFDDDEDLDLAIATTNGKVVLAVNDGDRGWPVFREGKLLVDQLRGGTLCAADADNDGRPDLFVQPASGGLQLYRNTSDGKTASVGPATAVKDSAGKLVNAPNPSAIDFDGDGVLDVVTSLPSEGVQLHLGVKDAKGEVLQLARPAVDETDKPIAGGNKAAMFDWDGDGTLDLLILDNSCTIRCHSGLKKGAPTFSGSATAVYGKAFGRAEERYAPALADVDRDGRCDLILGGSYDVGCGGSHPKLRLYRNTLTTGPRAFGAGVFVTGATGHLELHPTGYYEMANRA